MSGGTDFTDLYLMGVGLLKAGGSVLGVSVWITGPGKPVRKFDRQVS